jgi:hypothetical protein
MLYFHGLSFVILRRETKVMSDFCFINSQTESQMVGRQKSGSCLENPVCFMLQGPENPSGQVCAPRVKH